MPCSKWFLPTDRTLDFPARLRLSGAETAEENPASKPRRVQDVQGDRRWTSLHHRFVVDSKDKEPEAVFTGE